MGELKDRIAQVVMMGIEGLTPSKEERALIEQGVGGVILFERNCRNPAQVADLIEDLQETARAKEELARDRSGRFIIHYKRESIGVESSLSTYDRARRDLVSIIALARS